MASWLLVLKSLLPVSRPSVRRSIAFIIMRLNAYRYMGPAIDEALRRSWRVECWHDVSPMGAVRKAVDYPLLELAPARFQGRARIRGFHGRYELNDLIRTRAVDVVVNLVPSIIGTCGVLPPPREGRAALVLLEPAPCDWFTHVTDPEELLQTDLFCIASDYWLEQNVQLMHETLAFDFRRCCEHHFRTRARVVGWPQTDQLRDVDPAVVRKRLGIMGDRKVLVCFNWPNFGYFGLEQELFAIDSLQKRALLLLRRLRARAVSPLRALRLLFAPHIGHVMRALRRFCDCNDLVLVLKTRKRDPVLESERRYADLIVTDHEYYPHTVMGLMRIATLTAGFWTAGVRDSAAAGVPHLNFDVAGVRKLTVAREDVPYFERHGAANEMWNFAGVVTSMGETDVLKRLPRLGVDVFAVKQARLEEYRRLFVGGHVGANSVAFMDSVEELASTVERSIV